ncbi:MAG: hypothetical protein Q8R20_02100 [Nanoarchaeota archaeon]|nr:hypothetical protein [Nanoarchaeota archaeon]
MATCVVLATATSAAELRKTRVETVWPGVAVLDAGWEALDSREGWSAKKDSTENLSAMLALLAGRKDLDRVETHSIVSATASRVNDFFAKQGYELRIRDLGRDELAVGATFAAELEWLQEGLETHIEIGGKKYKAIDVSAGVRVLGFSGREVVEIQTRNGDVVYVTKVLDRDAEGLAKIETGTFDTNLFVNSYIDVPADARRRLGYKAVVLPEVRQLDTTFDLKALTGLMINDRDGTQWRITEAVQQIKFWLDRNGCGVKSAAAAIMSKGISSTYVVDGPFIIWARRPGVELPIFAGIIYPDEVGEEVK